MSTEQPEEEVTEPPVRRRGGWLLPCVWTITVGTALAIIAGFAALKTFTPRYRASHLLEANQDFILFRGTVPTIDRNLAETEAPIIRNRVVLDSVLTDSTLRKAPSLAKPDSAENNLRENLAVEGDTTGMRMYVSYVDTDREMAARVCNAIVSSYLRQRTDTDQTRIKNLENLLVPEIDYWKREVENKKEKVRSLSDQLLPGEDDPTREDLKRLKRKIEDVGTELAVIDALAKVEATIGESNESESNEARSASGTLADSDRERLELEVRLKILSQQYETMNTRLRMFVGRTASLQFAEDDLNRAIELLNKLQDRASAIRTERRILNAVRSLAIATPPTTPINSVFPRLAWSSGLAFLIPVVISLLWGPIPRPRD